MTRAAEAVRPGGIVYPAKRTNQAPVATDVEQACTRARTRTLFCAWQQRRDPRARERLVEIYMPMARRLARRYLGAHEPVEDLLQVSSLALLKAIDRFDPDRGREFSAYAVPTILGELRRYFRDCGWALHVPRGAQDNALRVERAVRELARGAARHPSVRELAEYLEWDLEDVLEALEAASAHHAASLDAPVRDAFDDATLGDSLGSEDRRIEAVDARVSVASAMRHLRQDERQVLRMRFGAEMTQLEIAQRLGVSQMQISRTLRRALTRLRELTDGSAPGIFRL
jgi:RNA polymerase sigma-B factor